MGDLIPAKHTELINEHVRRLSHLGEKGTRFYTIGKGEVIVLKPSATLHELAIHAAVLATFRYKLGRALEDAIEKRKSAMERKSNEYIYLTEALTGLHGRATIQLRRAKRALDMLAKKELSPGRKR